MEQNRIYTKIWEKLERNPPPESFRQVRELDYEEFRRKVQEQDAAFAQSIAEDFFAGDFFLLKNAFPNEFLENLKGRLMEYAEQSPSSFHKMLEGCPDFHRDQDASVAKKYSVEAVRHSFYFFRWNNDPLEIREAFYERWRVLKQASGRKPREWENNTPKDGVVDRIQIVKYPNNTGFIEPHVHDPHNQRLIINVYMSKRGVDYTSGGCHFFDGNDQRIPVENNVEVGDIGLFYASLRHSVDPILIDGSLLKNKSTDGRWWVGLYSPESNEVVNRRTSAPVSV